LPYRNSLAEARVKSTKGNILRSIRKQILSIDETLTLFAKAEELINSRPFKVIGKTGASPPITPNDLLKIKKKKDILFTNEHAIKTKHQDA
jgi:hypothetical protein